LKLLKIMWTKQSYAGKQEQYIIITCMSCFVIYSS